MKVDINVGILDHKVLDWYDSASENEVTNAIYHGYRVVSNPEYSKKLDEMPSSNDNLLNKIEMLENQIEMYKIQLKENQDSFNKQMDSMVLETKSRFESQYNGILKSSLNIEPKVVLPAPLKPINAILFLFIFFGCSLSNLFKNNNISLS